MRERKSGGKTAPNFTKTVVGRGTRGKSAAGGFKSDDRGGARSGGKSWATSGGEGKSLAPRARSFGKSYDEKKSFGDKPFGEKRFADKKGARSGGRSFADGAERGSARRVSKDYSPDSARPESARNDSRDRSRGEWQRDAGGRDERPRSRADGEAAPRKFGESKFGQRKFGESKFGERKFGDKKFSDRPSREKSFSDGSRSRGSDSRGPDSRGATSRGPDSAGFARSSRPSAERAEGTRGAFGRPDREFSDRPRFGDKKFADRKFSDRKPPDRKLSDRKPPDRKPSERKFLDSKFSGGGDTDRRERSSAPRREFSPRRSDSRGPDSRGAASREFAPRHDASETTSFAPPPEQHGHVRFYGIHAAKAALANPARKVSRICTHGGLFAEIAALVAELRMRDIKVPQVEQLERAELDALVPGAVHQGLVIEAAPLPPASLMDVIEAAPQWIVLLDQVTDPHNVGAIIRSACAFGLGAVIQTERHAPAATAVLAKTASGALEHTLLVSVTNLAATIKDLQQAGYWVIGLAEEGEAFLAAQRLDGKVALVLGAEGEGLRRLTRERCDVLARLPTGGPVGALNVSNAAAVAFYELVRAVEPKAA